MKRAGALLLAVAACTAVETAVDRARAALLGPETAIDAPITGVASGNQTLVGAGTGAAHWLVAWGDDRMNEEGSSEIWAARVAFDGGVLDPYGLWLGYGSDPAVACAPEPCAVVWTTYDTVRAQRLDATGAPVGSALQVEGNGNEKRTAAAASVDGGALISWAERIDGAWAIRARQFDADGGSRPAVGVTTDGGDHFDPAVIPSVNGEYWVAWADRRNGNGDIFVARMTGAGIVPVDGEQVSTSPIGEGRPAGAIDPASGQLLLAWELEGDVYGRRYDSFTGLAIDAAPFALNVQPADDGNVAVVWEGAQWLVAFERFSTTPAQIRGVRVTPGVVPGVTGPGAYELANDGEAPALVTGSGRTAAFFENSTAGLGVAGVTLGSIADGGPPMAPPIPMVALSANAQFGPDVAGSSSAFLVVWDDTRGSRQRPTMRMLDLQGSPIASTALLSSVKTEGTRVAASPDQFLAAWTIIEGTPTVKRTRVSAQGLALDPVTGTTTAFPQFDPAVAWGPGAFLLVWAEERTGGTDLYAERIQPDGGTSGAAALIAQPGAQFQPSVVGTANGWLLAWSQSDRINFSRVSAAGVALDVPPLTLGTSAARYHPSVATNGTDYLIAWFNNYTMVATRVLANGTVVDVPPLLLDSAVGASEPPRAAWDGQQYVVVWQGSDGQVFARAIPAAGTVPAGGRVELMPMSPRHDYPRIAYSGDSALVVAMADFRAAPIAAPRVVTRTLGLQNGGGACSLALECKTGFCVNSVCVLADGGFGGGAGGSGGSGGAGGTGGGGGGGGGGGTAGGTGGDGGGGTGGDGGGGGSAGGSGGDGGGGGSAGGSGGGSGGAAGGSAGGAGAGGGGTSGPRTFGVGCGCDAGGSTAAVFGLAVWALRRRRPGRATSR